MNTPMMKCGHAANATIKNTDGTYADCCAICSGPDAFIVANEKPSLVGRQSKCGDCGRVTPSSFDLPFFEYLGPGSKRSTEMCKCGYGRIAHEDRTPDNRHRNVVTEGKCKGFEAHGPYEFDRHYDGCRGWD